MSLTQVRALSSKVDDGLSSAFGSLATAITTRPILTIILTTALAFALAPGMTMGGKEANGENLWTPQDTEAKDQQAWVNGVFAAGDQRVQAYSLSNGANLLTHAGLAALETLQSGMVAVQAECKTGTCDGQTVTYAGVRAKQMTSILSLWGDKAPAAGSDILAVVNDESKWFSTSGDKLQSSDMMGGVQYDGNGKIIGAEAFLTTVWLKNLVEDVDDTRTDPRREAWELKFDDFVNGFADATLSKNYPYTRTGQQEAGGAAISKDVSLLSIGYMLLIVFSIIVLSHHKRVQSNGVMAMFSILSVGLSIVSAFGLCGYFGVKTNPVTTTLFLVLLGIGVDDSYVIMGDYRLAKGTAEERVVQALRKAGTSIAVTSMTDTVAFAAGISSTLPALSDFCIFATVGIFFDFFYQCTCGDNDKGLPDSPARRALRKITDVTLTRPGSLAVLVLTVGVLAGAVSGLPQLHTNFDIKWFTPDDSEYKDTYDMQNKYFATTGKGLPVYIYTKSGNYADAHADGSISALYQRTGSCSWIDRSINNWYSEFVRDAGRSTRSKTSEAAFATEVKAFVGSSTGARFAKDVVFVNSDNGSVSAIQGSRTMYLTKPTKNGEDDIKMTEAIRGCVNGNPLDAFAFSPAFLYFDGLAVVDKECIMNVLIACACVFIVNLVMLGDLLAATLVLSMIGLIDVCILGYMAHWSLDFNSVTAINLVLAVGLAVDYSAHIAHSFLVIQGPGLERAKEAVEHIGMSVLNGAFSTFLAVLPLSFSQSYVFRVFFKMWFMIILFGTYFGVIVLPVLLSVFSNCMGAPPQSVSEASVKPEPAPIGAAATGKDNMYIAKMDTE